MTNITAKWDSNPVSLVIYGHINQIFLTWSLKIRKKWPQHIYRKTKNIIFFQIYQNLIRKYLHLYINIKGIWNYPCLNSSNIIFLLCVGKKTRNNKTLCFGISKTLYPKQTAENNTCLSLLSVETYFSKCPITPRLPMTSTLNRTRNLKMQRYEGALFKIAKLTSTSGISGIKHAWNLILQNFRIPHRGLLSNLLIKTRRDGYEQKTKVRSIWKT